MDDQTDPYPDVDLPDTQPALPALLNQDWRVVEVRLARAQQAEAARAAELEQAQAFDAVGSPAEADVPLPLATPPSAALTF